MAGAGRAGTSFARRTSLTTAMPGVAELLAASDGVGQAAGTSTRASGRLSEGAPLYFGHAVDASLTVWPLCRVPAVSCAAAVKCGRQCTPPAGGCRSWSLMGEAVGCVLDRRRSLARACPRGRPHCRPGDCRPGTLHSGWATAPAACAVDCPRPLGRRGQPCGVRSVFVRGLARSLLGTRLDPGRKGWASRQGRCMHCLDPLGA